MGALFLLAVGLLYLAVVSMIRIPSEAVSAFAEATRAACRDAGISQKTLAIMLGLSDAQLSQWLAGQGNPALWRYFQLKDHPEGREFLKHFLPHIAETLGLPEYAEALKLRDVMLSLINSAQLKVAKAELKTAKTERTVA